MDCLVPLHFGWSWRRQITVGGTTTQWFLDGGDDNDTINVNNAAERTTVLGGSGADSINISVVSKGFVQAGVGNDTIKVTGTGVTSASLKAGVGDDLMSITGGITDGSLFGGMEMTASTSLVVAPPVLLTPVRCRFSDVGCPCGHDHSDWCSDQHISERWS